MTPLQTGNNGSRQYSWCANAQKNLLGFLEGRGKAQFGDESWELDALEPDILAGLVRDAVAAIRGPDAWKVRVEEEERHKGELAMVAGNWDTIVSGLEE